MFAKEIRDPQSRLIGSTAYMPEDMAQTDRTGAQDFTLVSQCYRRFI